MEIALSAATRHVDGASFLKYAWTAQPDMLVNQIQGRRCRNNDFMPGARVLFPLFNPTHIVLISTLHETFVLFTVLCFKWMRFIWFADVMKYGILILTVLKSYGNTLHRVFATARHYLVPYEWVNMILNYCFWCHLLFLFSEDLCPPVGEMQPLMVILGELMQSLTFYIKLCGSVYLRLQRRDVEKGYQRMLNYFVWSV